MLIVQTPTAPATIRDAIVDLLEPSTSDVRIASAYTTCSGSDIFFNCLSQFLSKAKINQIPKTLITSFDFGLTEPEVLARWSALPNTVVRVAGAHLVAKKSLIPSRAFHPKIYAFGITGAKTNVLVGSANLTGRGLSINTEAGWAERNVKSPKIDKIFSALDDETVELSPDLLAGYKSLRKLKPPPPALVSEIKPVPKPKIVAVLQLPPFRVAVEQGGLDPSQYREFWIQVKGLQGGSGSQLELPRQGHQFFGFKFNNYSFTHKTTIGTPVLRAGNTTWTNKLLTWHGDNRMERINLPTLTQGGFVYSNAAVLFRRLPGKSFELVVAPWQSDLARAWLKASIQKSLVFRLGSQPTSRVVGLI